MVLQLLTYVVHTEGRFACVCVENRKCDVVLFLFIVVVKMFHGLARLGLALIDTVIFFSLRLLE